MPEELGSINRTRIESYPTGEQLGRYVFFLDCSGHVADAPLGEALQGLRRTCADVRFLGSYPRAAGTAAGGGGAGGGGAGGGGAAAGAARPAVDDFADSAAWLARMRAGELG